MHGNMRQALILTFLLLSSLIYCNELGASQALVIRSVGDINGDGGGEICVLAFDPEKAKAELFILETLTGNLLKKIEIDKTLLPVDIEVLKAPVTTSKQLALLSVHSENRRAYVRVYDLKTWKRLNTVRFGAKITPTDLEIVSNGNGEGELAVCGRSTSDDGAVVEVRNLVTGALKNRFRLGRGFIPIDIETVPGQAGSMDLAVLLQRKSDGLTVVKVIETEAGRIVQKRSFGTRLDSLDLEIVVGSDGSPEAAVLEADRQDGSVRVALRKIKQPSRIREVKFKGWGEALQLEVIPGANGGAARLAVLSRHPSAGEIRVELRDASTGGSHDSLSFGISDAPVALEAVDPDAGGSSYKLAVLEDRTNTHPMRVKLKDSTTGALLRTIPIEHDSDGSATPFWYDQNRVQAQTRLYPMSPRGEDGGMWWDTPESNFAARGFSELGVNVFTRHAKTMGEDPWWSSALPSNADGMPILERGRDNVGIWVPEGFNLPQQSLNDAHRHGMHMVAYYWHMADDRYLKRHPGWACREPDGTPISHKDRGVYLDITGPYREIVLQRLLELAGMGARGINFDHVHLPPEGCWGSSLEQSFSNATGLPAPGKIDGSPTYLMWLDHKAQKIEETFSYWNEMIHRQYPDVQLIISASDLPGLTRRATTSRLARIAVSKSEYRLALAERADQSVFKNNPDMAVPPDDVRMALGWTLLRDAAEGRPPRIWVCGVPNEAHALSAVASLLTHGCVTNLDVAEENILETHDPPGTTPRQALASAFDLGKKASPVLAGGRPVRFAAVHFSERSRNARGANYRRAWEEVLWPLTGAYGVFLRHRAPVGVITDEQLEQGSLDEYKILFLPTLAELTENQTLAVQRFAASGNLVITNDPEWLWSDPERTKEAADSLDSIIRNASIQLPVEVRGGPEKLHAVAFRNDGVNDASSGRVVVAVVNDFSWVQLTTKNRILPDEEVNEPAPVVEAGVQVLIGEGYGLPVIPMAGKTLKVYDAVSGQQLDFEVISEGLKMTLPAFPTFMLIVVDAS